MLALTVTPDEGAATTHRVRVAAGAAGFFFFFCGGRPVVVQAQACCLLRCCPTGCGDAQAQASYGAGSPDPSRSMASVLHDANAFFGRACLPRATSKARLKG